jgi:hypothetical protein
VYAFSMSDLVAEPILVLSYFPCRATGVSHDPVTGYYYQECNSIFVSTVDGEDALDFLTGLPTYFGCGSASVAFDWERRVAYIMCRFLGVVAVQLDFSLSSDERALAVRLTTGWGPSCSTASSNEFNRLARPERGGQRVMMNCADGLNYIAGRTTITIGDAVCRVPNADRSTLTFDETGRGYSSCSDAGGLTMFEGLVGAPLQYNRTICRQPYLVQYSRLTGDRLLWLSCGTTATTGFNIVTYNLDTRETKERVGSANLGQSNGAGQMFKITLDGRVYFTQYPSVNRPHTLYRLAPSAEIGYEMVHPGFVSNQPFVGLEVINERIFFLYLNITSVTTRHPMVWMKPSDLSVNATVVLSDTICRASDLVADPKTGLVYIACSCPITDTCSKQADFWPERSLVILNSVDLTYRQLNLINPLTSIAWNAVSNMLFAVGKANYLTKAPVLVVNVLDFERRLTYNVVIDVVTSPTYVLVDRSTGLTYLQSSAVGLMALPDRYGCPRGFEFFNGECQACKSSFAQSVNGNPNATFPRCTSCENGYIASLTGSIKCQACPAGFFQDPLNRPQYCDVCQPGTVSSQLASTNCTACEPGKYAPDVKLTACLLCEPGTYSAGYGASSCLPCQRGSRPIRVRRIVPTVPQVATPISPARHPASHARSGSTRPRLVARHRAPAARLVSHSRCRAGPHVSSARSARTPKRERHPAPCAQ